MKTIFAFVALGSNMDAPRRNVQVAIQMIEQHFSDGSIMASSLWETTPVNCPPNSAMFVNAVVGFVPRSGMTPEKLLAMLQAMERAAGRQPKIVLNEPRPLDLDLIAFGSETRNSPTLVLPHPRAHQRRFVLQPLCEIAPDLILPAQSKTISELLAALETAETLMRLASEK